MALKAGTTTQEKDSMAQAIDQAFGQAWPSFIETMDPPATTSPDLQLLFVAIAQGVVGYLKSHQNDFVVTVTVSGAHAALHTASAKVEIT
jgi:hypothetical protein